MINNIKQCQNCIWLDDCDCPEEDLLNAEIDNCDSYDNDILGDKENWIEN